MMYKTEQFEISCEDNMKLMARYPDKYFDLAILDPPYGIGISENPVRQMHNKKKWDDSAPGLGYFIELKRISKNQIIWGGNYFSCLWEFGCKGFIFWHKGNPVANFSDGELAYTSFDRPAKCFDFRYYGGLEGKTSASDKIHPTQKPVALYEWLFKNYAKEGEKILDTHLGSGSIAIALHRMNQIEKMNLTLTACELDQDYYNDAIKRIKQQTAQGNLFTEAEAMQQTKQNPHQQKDLF